LRSSRTSGVRVGRVTKYPLAPMSGMWRDPHEIPRDSSQLNPPTLCWDPYSLEGTGTPHFTSTLELPRASSSPESLPMLRLLEPPPRGLQGVAHQGPGVLNSSHKGHLLLRGLLGRSSLLGCLQPPMLFLSDGEHPKGCRQVSSSRLHAAHAFEVTHQP
jgi:hypothetical protein